MHFNKNQLIHLIAIKFQNKKVTNIEIISPFVIITQRDIVHVMRNKTIKTMNPFPYYHHFVN